MVLGKLESTLKNGRSFEMEYAAQVLFVDSKAEKPKVSHYKVWAVSFMVFLDGFMELIWLLFGSG